MKDNVVHDIADKGISYKDVLVVEKYVLVTNKNALVIVNDSADIGLSNKGVVDKDVIVADEDVFVTN